jgi:lipid-binding SYLF domain-containing protein
MRTLKMKLSTAGITLLLTGALAAVDGAATTAHGQVAGWKAEDEAQVLEKGLYQGALATVTAFQEKDPDMASFFEKAHAYVVFPTIGKGGVGIGGAYGKGVLFQGGQAVGEASLSQVTIGFQWGGQAYSEIIFFETEADTDRFRRSNFEVAAQASAVAATLGASRDVSYEGGVAIFTMAKGGLMYEATVGGQKFKFEEKAPPGS